jgi:hypothetical protein
MRRHLYHDRRAVFFGPAVRGPAAVVLHTGKRPLFALFYDVEGGVIQALASLFPRLPSGAAADQKLNERLMGPARWGDRFVIMIGDFGSNVSVDVTLLLFHHHSHLLSLQVF